MKYFWLNKHIDQWNAAISNDHKPQAVMVSGAAGTGKAELTNQLIANLVCRVTQDGRCGECQNCTLHKQGHHPDVHSIIPEKNVVKVKMIRDLTEFFTSTPHCSDHKIAVIHQADCMNVAAANALLKVLEEPPSRGILFLLTDSKHQLMPTIISRCIALNVTITTDEKNELTPWLQQLTEQNQQAIKDALILSDFQPKSALNLLLNNQLDVLKSQLDGFFGVFNHELTVSMVAKQMIEEQHADSWAFLQRYCLQLLKSILNPSQHEIYANHPFNQLLKKSPKVIHIIIKMTDLIQQFMLNLTTQIKAQLLLESLLVDVKNEFNHGS